MRSYCIVWELDQSKMLLRFEWGLDQHYQPLAEGFNSGEGKNWLKFYLLKAALVWNIEYIDCPS